MNWQLLLDFRATNNQNIFNDSTVLFSEPHSHPSPRERECIDSTLFHPRFNICLFGTLLWVDFSSHETLTHIFHKILNSSQVNIFFNGLNQYQNVKLSLSWHLDRDFTIKFLPHQQNWKEQTQQHFVHQMYILFKIFTKGQWLMYIWVSKIYQNYFVFRIVPTF